MDVFDAVRTVRAIRSFRDTPVPEPLVRQIVEAAHLTASSINKQPWHFVVVQERQTLKSLGELAKTGPYIAQAPLAVAVAYEKDSPFGVSDVSRAIQVARGLKKFAKSKGRKVSGLFLLEQAADGVDWIVWIRLLLLLLLLRSRTSRTTAQAAELRLQHTRRHSPYVGNERRILGSSLDLERDRRPTPSSILAVAQHSADPTGYVACYFSEQPTESTCPAAGVIRTRGGLARRTGSSSRSRALQSCGHLEVQIILRVDVSVPDQRSQSWH